MPLQVGAWTANVGGSATSFSVNSVDSQGNVIGTLGPNSAFGFWDEDSQKLLFLCTPGSGGVFQIFEAYLFTDSVNLTGVTGAVIFTLAGVVQDFIVKGQFVGPTPTATRSNFGWYAQIGID